VSGPVEIRAPVPGDLEATLAVVVARDVADLGEPDYTLEDLRQDWEDADLERDAWLAVLPGGGIAGYALLHGEHAVVLTHPDHEGRGIGGALHDRLVARAQERSARLLRQEVSAASDSARRLLEDRGWRGAGRHWRMRVTFAGPPPAPAWPPGVSVSSLELEDDLEAVHALIEDAFTDVPNHVPRDLEERRAVLQRTGFEAALSPVARADGVIAGAVLGWRWEEGVGFVSHIAVARDQRGRGLGRALLAEAFGRFHAAGLAGAVLGVNTANRTALSLYESAGMAPAFVIDAYELALGA
jgi:mycothiol synthase